MTALMIPFHTACQHRTTYSNFSSTSDDHSFNSSSDASDTQLSNLALWCLNNIKRGPQLIIHRVGWNLRTESVDGTNSEVGICTFSCLAACRLGHLVSRQRVISSRRSDEKKKHSCVLVVAVPVRHLAHDQALALLSFVVVIMRSGAMAPSGRYLRTLRIGREVSS